MQTIDAKQFMDSFRYVQRAFETAAELLKAGDGLVRKYGFQVHGDSWKAASLPQSHFKLSYVDQWVPHYVVRQYYSQADDLLTLAVIPWDRNGRIQEPWCLASYLKTKTVESNDVYWLPLCQIRSAFGPDGKVRDLSLNDVVEYDDDQRQSFRAIVQGTVKSIGVPLLSIEAPQSLEAQVIAPLCDALSGRAAA